MFTEAQIGQRPSRCRGFYLSLSLSLSLTHTHITIGRTLLYKLSARRRGRYLNNTQQTQEKNIHTHSSEFEPTVPAIKRPQTYALDRNANGMALLPHY
jgi:hypothetical protein